MTQAAFRLLLRNASSSTGFAVILFLVSIIFAASGLSADDNKVDEKGDRECSLPDSHPSLCDPVFTGITEIILVVHDLDKSMRQQWELFGIGPWEVWTFDSSTVSEMTSHDQRRDFAMKIAYTKIGGVHWELVQPLDKHSTYYETLRDHGEGVHNIVFSVSNFEATQRFMEANGIGVYNGGNWQGVKFVNFDTRPHLPVVAEIFDVPEGAAFPPPEAVFPDPALGAVGSDNGGND